MDEFEALGVEFDAADEYLAADEPYPEYQEDGYVDADEYWEEEPAEAPAVPANLLDYLAAVSLSAPVLAVVFIGLFLIFLTSLINYGPALDMLNAKDPPVNNQNALVQDIAQNKAYRGSNDALPLMFTPEVRYWEADILKWASERGIDPLLAATVMQIESCGYSDALSRAGAMGLFQVMPYHFQAGEDGFDPATNALRGLAYLSQALNAHQGEVRLALAGYNAGIAGSSQLEAFWPAETKRYVYWGTGIYADALEGLETSARLQEWLDVGGRSLCDQASQALGLP